MGSVGLWLLAFAFTFVVSALKLGGVLPAIDSSKSTLRVTSLPLLGGEPHSLSSATGGPVVRGATLT